MNTEADAPRGRGSETLRQALEGHPRLGRWHDAAVLCHERAGRQGCPPHAGGKTRIDIVLANERAARLVTSCEVVDDTERYPLPGHRPVVVTLSQRAFNEMVGAPLSGARSTPHRPPRSSTLR
eukprot:TRINITY_DN3328_c0_g1_i4.p6 TRINITY_DN3328_c0_g1~~TRINITY_DN3328_c0_g1_i4.p6  ORF type:complete len:123 (-),score=2.80 TRINITY_DN3328_c0_g1_i4:130-498(-)